MPTKHTGIITFQGGPLTLVGDEVKVGDNAPNFKIANGLGDFAELSDYADQTVVLSVVPSLDTGVCNAQSRRFNEIAGELGDAAVVLTVSMDLPTAQGRWAEEAEAENLTYLSDYRDHSFGLSYGVRIDELGVLARSVWVVKDGKVVYKQIVPETVDEPDYDAAVAAVRGA